VTVPALWLVSGGSADGTRGAGDGLPAGAGVAVQYVALGLAHPAAGLWPVAVGRVAAVLPLLPTALRHRPPRPPSRLTAQALLVGAVSRPRPDPRPLAAQRQLLAVAVVLASLYPTLRVILGLALLHERITRRQRAGLLGAAAATVLLTLG